MGHTDAKHLRWIGFEPQKCIDYAVAASCLKQTMEWDVNLSTEKEIMTLVNGDGSGRVQR